MIKELQGNLLHQIKWNEKFLSNFLLQKYKPMKSDMVSPIAKLRAMIWKATRTPEVIHIVLMFTGGAFFHSGF